MEFSSQRRSGARKRGEQSTTGWLPLAATCSMRVARWRSRAEAGLWLEDEHAQAAHHLKRLFDLAFGAGRKGDHVQVPLRIAILGGDRAAKRCTSVLRERLRVLGNARTVGKRFKNRL